MTRQIATSIGWPLDVIFPNPFRSFVDVMAYMVDINPGRILPLECVITYSHHTHLRFITLASAVLLAALGVLALWFSRHTGYLAKVIGGQEQKFHSSIGEDANQLRRSSTEATKVKKRRRSMTEGTKAKNENVKSRVCVSLALLVSFVVLPAISSAIFRTFMCE